MWKGSQSVKSPLLFWNWRLKNTWELFPAPLANTFNLTRKEVHNLYYKVDFLSGLKGPVHASHYFVITINIVIIIPILLDVMLSYRSFHIFFNAAIIALLYFLFLCWERGMSNALQHFLLPYVCAFQLKSIIKLLIALPRLNGMKNVFLLGFKCNLCFYWGFLW